MTAENDHPLCLQIGVVGRERTVVEGLRRQVSELEMDLREARAAAEVRWNHDPALLLVVLCELNEIVQIQTLCLPSLLR